MPSLAKCTMLTQQSTLLSPALIPFLLYISLRLWGCPLPSHTGRKGLAHCKNTRARHEGTAYLPATCFYLNLSLPFLLPATSFHLQLYQQPTLSPLFACAYV